MKNQLTLTAIALLFTMAVKGQNTEEARLMDDYELVNRGKLTRKVPPATQGSPYLNKFFVPAKVANISKGALMRYDAYNDEFEFIDPKKDTLVLNKEEKLSNIIFTGTNTKYELLTYVNKKGTTTHGYLNWIHESNGYALYKKQSVTYIKEEVAERPFERSTPARFDRGEDVFYLKASDKGVIPFPDGKKAMAKLFPERKAAIEAFLKQHNIDFDKEADLKKVVDFLATQS